MAYDPVIHQRRSVRLKGFDYASPLWYFVTICTREKKPMLGEVIDGEMHLNEAGQIVRKAWELLPGRFPGVSLDENIVMPNHIHGIIQLVGRSLLRPRRAQQAVPLL